MKLTCSLQLVLCWVCIDCSRGVLLQQQSISRAPPVKPRGRQLLQLSTVYVSNATGFIAALADPAVGLIRVVVPELDVPLSAWETSGFKLPFVISRDVTIEGDPSLDEWPIILFNYAKGRMRLANSVTFTIRHVFSPKLRLNPSRAPGLDFLAPTFYGGPPARAVLGPAATSIGICFPPAYQVTDVSYMPRPSDFPGVNNLSYDVSQAGCVNNSAAHPLKRCWASKAYFTDMAYYGADYDAVRDSTISNNQVFNMVNATAFCETLVDEDCLSKLGQAPLVCFKEAERRYDEEAARTAAAAAAGGGGGRSSSSTPSAVPRSGGETPGSGAAGGLAPTAVQDNNGNPAGTSHRSLVIRAATITAGTLLAVVIVVAATVAWARRRGGSTTAAACRDGSSNNNKESGWRPGGEEALEQQQQQQEGSRGSSGSNSVQAAESGRLQQQQKSPAAAGKGGLLGAAAASGFMPENVGTKPRRDQHEDGPPPELQRDAAGCSAVYEGLRAAGSGAAPESGSSTVLAVAPFVKRVGLLAQPAEDKPITMWTPPRAEVALGVRLQEAQEGSLQQHEQHVHQQQHNVQTEEGSLSCTTFVSIVTGSTSTPEVHCSSDTSSSRGVTGGTGGAHGASSSADGTGGTGACAGSGPPVVELLPVVLGKGAFGRVVEGMFGGRRVAVKLMASDGPCWGGGGLEQQQPADTIGSSDAFTRSFVQEVQVLSRVQHPNVVQLLAACVTPPRLCLVMELMEMSLAGLMYGGGADSTGRPGGLMPLEKVLHIGIDIANALAYLHPTIVHRDLKPANVLVNDSASDHPVVKLTDFGLSRLRVTVASTKNGDEGTPPYMAPECFDLQSKHITHHSDMYSLGVILWEMLTGTRPWAGVSPVAVAFMVTYQGLRLPLEGPQLNNSRFPPKLVRLIQDCWETDPARRPAAAEAAKELMLVLIEARSAHAGGVGACPGLRESDGVLPPSAVSPAFNLRGRGVRKAGEAKR